MARKSKWRRMKDVASKRERTMRSKWWTRTAEVARESRRTKRRGGDRRASIKNDDGGSIEKWKGKRRGTSTTTQTRIEDTDKNNNN
jgi:hypothetical protein